MNRPQDFGHLKLAMVEGVPLEADVALASISHQGVLPQVKQVVTFLPSQWPLIIIVGVSVDTATTTTTLCRESLQSTFLASGAVAHIRALFLCNYYNPADAPLRLQLGRLYLIYSSDA